MGDVSTSPEGQREGTGMVPDSDNSWSQQRAVHSSQAAGELPVLELEEEQTEWQPVTIPQLLPSGPGRSMGMWATGWGGERRGSGSAALWLCLTSMAASVT